MASKQFEEWLKSQKHNPDDKITNFQRLKSKYLVPKGVTTWGEWYEQAGVTPDTNEEKPKTPTAKTEKAPTTVSGIRGAINDLKDDITYDQYLLGQIETRKGLDSAEYKKKAADIVAKQKKIKDFNLSLKAAKKDETATTKQTDLQKTEEDLQRAKASGDPKAIQNAQNAFAMARNAAIKAGVTGPGGTLLGAKDAKAPTGVPAVTLGNWSSDKEKGILKDGKPWTGKYVVKVNGETLEYDVVDGHIKKGSTYNKYDSTGKKRTYDSTNDKEITTSDSATTAGKPALSGNNNTAGKTDGKKKATPDKGVKVPTDAEQKDTALDTAATDFDLPETIFNNVPSLKLLLERYVKEDWTPEKLRKEIRDDNWFRKNSTEIKNRYVQLFNYQDLVKTGQADGSTDYEKQIATLERKLADKARAIGSGLASDPAALRKAAENMYITNVGIDDAMTTDFIAAAIRPITSTIGGKVTEGYSGQALKDYQDLQAVAKANGFKVSDILPGKTTELQVLQGLATGSIDANRLAQDARKLAAQGQPQYVRDLLGQGYNLDQVFAPYRNTMASILEIDDPNSIDLNDQTLRSAISDKGDMNVYDFKKLLKADNRWQYTENAKKEVADSALSVLRDFGFQG